MGRRNRLRRGAEWGTASMRLHSGRPAPSVVRLTMRRSVPFRGRFCSSVDVLRRSLFGFGGIDDWPKRGTERLCVGIRRFCVRSAVHRFPNAVPRLDRFRFSAAIGAGRSVPVSVGSALNPLGAGLQCAVLVDCADEQSLHCGDGGLQCAGLSGPNRSIWGHFAPFRRVAERRRIRPDPTGSQCPEQR